MATKSLARTIIEGGRARYNKWERNHSHKEERALTREYLARAREVDDGFEALCIGRRPKVYKGFSDKLGAPRRWLRSQVGRPWDKVRSEIFTQPLLLPGHRGPPRACQSRTLQTVMPAHAGRDEGLADLGRTRAGQAPGRTRSMTMAPPPTPDVIATEKTWIESAALEQLRQVAALPGMVRVVGMPDLHPGAGSPVGAAFLSDGLFYPHLVGSDIGCGMALWDTGLPLRKVKLDRLERRLDLEQGTPGAAASHLAAEGASSTGHEDSLGTIGGGNHFAELVKVEKVLERNTLRTIGADPGNAWLLVHSGSRGLGHAINRRHVAKWRGEGIDPDSDAGRSYLEAHDNAVRWARANRAIIAERFLSALGSEGRRVLDIAHNSVQPAPDTQGQWLHRKGAAPADDGPVVIPGSRGDLSYVVTPAGDGDRNLSSLAHGAGRKWARSETKGKLGAKADPKALRRTRFGSRVICDDKALLFEEAPQAYKPAADVIAALVEAGIATVIAETSPLLTYKTRRHRT